MKYLIPTLAFAFGFVFSIAGQNISLGNEAVTRAVVIGISEYQHIPNLEFAHRDAEAFAAFLQSPAGGSVPANHIHKLINEEATLGQMVNQMGWLMEQCKEGDKAIIYFSGHGDVETETIGNLGFFLMYDTPKISYMAGGYPLMYLNIIISTLSERNKAEVILISDACRSGKLAGSDIQGAQITNANLSQKVNNEIKILSCQSDEYSIEGLQWGGGRGAFSYHLVEGLTGLADRDEDTQVKLMEIDAYLKEMVPKETNPHSQIPNTIGNLKSTVSLVDQKSLYDLKNRKSEQLAQLKSVDTKGFEAEILAKLDTSIQELYAAFEQAIDHGDLLTPIGSSADDYYKTLIREKRLLPVHGLMTRNFAAALQDESQQVLNQLLLTDPQIVDDAFSPVNKYDHIPAYLNRACELLGQQHYMYPILKAKQYFFKSKTYRKENYPDLSPDTLVSLSLISLDSALFYDSTAAYVYMEKGQLCFWNNCQPTFSYENALEASEKAVQLSPKWVIPIYYAGRWNLWFGKIEKGNSLLKQAVTLDSMFLPTYWLLAFESGGEKRKYWDQQYVDKMQEFMANHPGHVPIVYYRYFGFCLGALERYEEAEQVLLKAADLTNHQDPYIFNALGSMYQYMEKYEEAEKNWIKAIELNPLIVESFFALGTLYFYKKAPPKEAIKYFRKAIENDPSDGRSYGGLTNLFIQIDQLDSAEMLLYQWQSYEPENPYINQLLGQVYLLKDEKEKARKQFQAMLAFPDNGWLPRYYSQIIAHYQVGNRDSLDRLIEETHIQFKDDPEFYFIVASAYAFNGEDALALEYLEQAFKKGWKKIKHHVWKSLWSPDLFHLRNTPAFKALVEKYLPEKVGKY